MSLIDIAPVEEKRVDINETVDNANGVFDSKTSVVDTSTTGDNVSNEDNVCDHDDNAVFPESSGPINALHVSNVLPIVLLMTRAR